MPYLTGCGGSEEPEAYVARVGDAYLTEAELSQSIGALPADVDTAEARQQIVEQWVTRTLLLREAERLNLREEPDVQRQIRQQERSILVTALTDRMYEQADVGPSETEIRNYFQSNRDQLTLREPFVQVRHLAVPSRSTAEQARSALQEAATRSAPLDSTFDVLLSQYVDHPAESRRLAATFVPESRLFGHHPYVRDELAELGPAQISPVVEDDSLFHVVQLVERIPAGSEPELRWVRDQIRRRLTIRSRKQMYAREVQQLRNQAAARNELDLPNYSSSDGEHVEEPPGSPDTLSTEPGDVDASGAPEPSPPAETPEASPAPSADGSRDASPEPTDMPAEQAPDASPDTATEQPPAVSSEPSAEPPTDTTGVSLDDASSEPSDASPEPSPGMRDTTEATDTTGTPTG
jgi:hypothetical protein